MQVQKLLSEGADLLQMVTLANSNPKGSVVDFAYSAFSQVRKLTNTLVGFPQPEHMTVM